MNVKDKIERIIRQQTDVNWLIVHEITRGSETYTDVEFSFVDGKERRDEPFGTNQGYISLKSEVVIDEVKQVILELADVFRKNDIALANLYILTCRLSYSAEDDESILSELVKALDSGIRNPLFEVLLTSLNESYYKEHRLFSESPKSVEDWLSLFNSVDYLHTISNPVPQCLMLIDMGWNKGVDFFWIKKMKPLLRAVLMGQYAYDLTMSDTELTASYESEEDLLFLAACLLDDIGPDKKPLPWLNKNLVTVMMKRWDLIGKSIFVHVFGISYRNKNSNKAYEQLGNLIHEVLHVRLVADNTETHKWIDGLKFPNGFIAFFWWIKSKDIDLRQIPEANTEKIATHFLSELERILHDAPDYFVDDRRSDPLTTHQLSEEKYGLALVYILLFLIYSSEENVNRFKSICMRIKPFYYGAYQASLFATRFTQVMFLIFLSAESIPDIDKKAIESLKKYLEVISDWLLVSYVHLEERDDEVWNPESEKEIFNFNAGRYLVKGMMQSIRKHQVSEYYEDFFKSINETAIAKWG